MEHLHDLQRSAAFRRRDRRLHPVQRHLGIEVVVEGQAHRDRVDGVGIGQHGCGAVRLEEQEVRKDERVTRHDGHPDRVLDLVEPRLSVPVGVLVRDQRVGFGRKERKREDAGCVGQGTQVCLTPLHPRIHPVFPDGLEGEPVGGEPRHEVRFEVRPRREEEVEGELHRVLVAVLEPWEHRDPIERPVPEPAFHGDRDPVTRSLDEHLPRPGRDHDGVSEGTLGEPLAHDLREPDLDRIVERGDDREVDGAGLDGPERDLGDDAPLGSLRTGARRDSGGEARAKEETDPAGDHGLPSTASFSASFSRWPRNAASFSRSLRTTASGARPTKLGFPSFVSARST